MRTVNVAELKNQLSAYLRFAKAGETIIVRERSRPVAMLVPFTAEDATEEDLALVATGKMRLPIKRMNWEEFNKLPRAQLSGEAAGTDTVTQALLEERLEGR